MNYNCNECKKCYTSYQSYWNHNKKFHVNNKTIIIKDINKIYCDYCNKNFLNKYTLKNHLKICHIKKYNDNSISNENNNIDVVNNEQNNINVSTNNLNDNDNIKLKIQLTEIEKIKEENKNLELKLKIEKVILSQCKMHHKTFKSFNSKLIDNSINNSNNTINNITNNFKIYSIGKENLLDILTLSEKNKIMRSRYNCLDRLV